MKRASIELKIAERDSLAFRWLRIAAALRQAGDIYEAKLAVRTSRIWPAPALPDRKAA